MKHIKPIRTEVDYENALAIIDSNFDAQAGTPGGDLVEVLAVLVEDYERKHFPVALPDPIEAILYHLESRGLDRKYLERFIGSRGRVSEILNKKRPLSMEMIRNLHQGLGIPLEILLQKYMDELEPVGVAIKKTAGKIFSGWQEEGAAWISPESLDFRLPDTRRPARGWSDKPEKLVTRATCCAN